SVWSKSVRCARNMRATGGGRSHMCTGHEEAVGPREMARLLSRRGFLRATAGTAAVAGAAGAVGAVGSFASPAAATETGHDHSPAATHRVPVDKISIQLFTLR